MAPTVRVAGPPSPAPFASRGQSAPRRRLALGRRADRVLRRPVPSRAGCQGQQPVGHGRRSRARPRSPGDRAVAAHRRPRRRPRLRADRGGPARGGGRPLRPAPWPRPGGGAAAPARPGPRLGAGPGAGGGERARRRAPLPPGERRPRPGPGRRLRHPAAGRHPVPPPRRRDRRRPTATSPSRTSCPTTAPGWRARPCSSPPPSRPAPRCAWARSTWWSGRCGDEDRPVAVDPLRHTTVAGTIPFNRPPRPAPPPPLPQLKAPAAAQGRRGQAAVLPHRGAGPARHVGRHVRHDQAR